MKAVCESVLERVALGEPLAELADHVAACPRCERAVALPGLLGAAHDPEVDPGLGFSARMTAGAQHRIALRRKRRIAGTLAASVAAAAVAVFVVTRPPAPSEPPAQPAVEVPQHADEQPVALEDAELEALLQLANTARARRVSAPWDRIQRPLAPYIQLVKGVTP